MDYVLLIYTAENRQRSPEEQATYMSGYMSFSKELAGSGRMGPSAPLEHTRTATSVRIRDGKRVVTDGPFAETREQLGGFYTVSVASEEEALALAAKIPDAVGGAVEVRPARAMPPGTPQEKVESNGDPKEYILLVYESEKDWNALSDADRGALYGRYMKFRDSIRKSGQFISGAPLDSIAKAKTVRMVEGKRIVTDGPFAETREQLGGYFEVRAKNLDVAIELAAQVPASESGTMEVRPVKVLPGM